MRMEGRILIMIGAVTELSSVNVTSNAVPLPMAPDARVSPSHVLDRKVRIQNLLLNNTLTYNELE